MDSWTALTGTSIRDRIKELEWHLPVPVQRLLLQGFGRRHNPYTVWNHDHRSIFIHVPRTGGTSLSRALGARHEHFPISRYAGFDRDAFRHYFKFAFVRNPWDRLLSAYVYLRAGIEKPGTFPDKSWAQLHLSRFADFEEFVLALRDPATRRTILRYIHFRPQLNWIRLPSSMRVELDFVGRFETLEQDFQILAERFSVLPTLSKVRQTSHPPYREAFTPVMRDVATALYRADIDAFGYNF